MEAKSQRPKGQEGAVLALNEALEALDPADISNIPSARVVFSSVTVLLALIKVCFLLSPNHLLQVHTELGFEG